MLPLYRRGRLNFNLHSSSRMLANDFIEPEVSRVRAKAKTCSGLWRGVWTETDVPVHGAAPGFRDEDVACGEVLKHTRTKSSPLRRKLRSFLCGNQRPFINNPQFGNIKPVWKYHVCFPPTGHQGNCQGWVWVFKENAREKTKTISCWIAASTHATGWLVPNQAGQEPESCATAKAEIELCVWSDANLEDLRSLEKQPVREGTFQLRFKSSLHLSLPLHRVWAKGLLLQRPFATGSAHKWTWNCFISVINYLFCLYWPLWGFCTLVHLSCWTFNYISKCTFFFRILFQTKVNYLKHFYMFAGVLYIAGDLCMFLFVGVLPNFLIG